MFVLFCGSNWACLKVFCEIAIEEDGCIGQKNSTMPGKKNKQRRYRKKKKSNANSRNAATQLLTPENAAAQLLTQEKLKSPSDALMKLIKYHADRVVFNKKPDNDFVNFCLSSLHLLGETTYDNLSKLWEWIPVNTLCNIIRDIKFPPGINPTLNQLIHLKFELVDKRAKMCVLILEEMTLKKPRNSRRQCVDIYEDDGVTKTGNLAKFATFIAIRGMFSDWSLPVAYFLTSKQASPDQLKSNLLSVLQEMEKCGLIIKVVVSKLTGNFFQMSQQLGISTTRQTFEAGGRSYYFMFDALQLMNATRNNLMKYEIHFENHRTLWAYLKAYYLQCLLWGHPDMPLGDAHVRPSKEDLLDHYNAITVLSPALAQDMGNCLEEGFLPKSAKGTIEFISFFGELFTFMNSTQGMNDYSEPYTGSTDQLNFLEKCCRFLDSLQVNSGDRNITSDVKFISAWKINLLGLPEMWREVLKELQLKDETRELTHQLWMNRLQASDAFVDFIYMPPVTAKDLIDNFEMIFVHEYISICLTDKIDLDEYINLISKKIPDGTELRQSTHIPKLLKS